MEAGPTRGPRRKRRLPRRLLLVGLVLAASLALFPFLERYLIFHPDPHLVLTPERMGLEYEDVRLTTEDGVRLHGWFIPAQPSSPPRAGASPLPMVLFFHGNAGNVSHFLEKNAELVKRGVSVFTVDYRGYGLSEGTPSEKGVYLDAAAAYEYLRHRAGGSGENIVIYGYSLGGAVAVQLAGQVPARALILESTFTSLRDMGKITIPILPRFVISPAFESLARIPRLHVPTLFIHGKNDQVVPMEMGVRLYDSHPGPKSLYLIDGAGHIDTDLVGGETYHRRIVDFIGSTIEQPTR